MKSMTLGPIWSLSRVMVVSLFCAGVAACSPGSFTVDGGCIAEAKAVCHFQYNCCNASERRDTFSMNNMEAYDDESSCVDVYTRSLCAAAERMIDSVDAERAAWDETKAEACNGSLYDALDACDAKTVFSWNEQSNACKTIITGKVATNGVCFESYECAVKGSICQNNGSTNPTPPLVTSEGKCVPPAALGQSCAMKACAPDLYCDFMATTCAALKADGAMCLSSQECQNKNCMTGMCGPKKPDGQMCQVDQECQSGNCDNASQTCGMGMGVMPTYDLCTGEHT